MYDLVVVDVVRWEMKKKTSADQCGKWCSVNFWDDEDDDADHAAAAQKTKNDDENDDDDQVDYLLRLRGWAF